MGEFNITTLGCGSARPTPKHLPSSTVVDYRGNLMMVDCGEGAQRQLMKYRLKSNRLRHIFLTHLHGDHVLGLPGLVSTLGLQETGGDLTIHTFREGERILKEMFRFFCPSLTFDLHFNILDPIREEVVWENSSMAVRSIPLSHRVPCVGYVFEEKGKLRHLNREMCDYHKVPVAKFASIKRGEDFINSDGLVIANERLTTPADRALSYAHISDTAYMPELAEKIKGVNLLFHETTYMSDLEGMAKERGHSTARQAARTALDAGAGWLLTGHYSSRYKDDEGFRKEALEVFPNVITNHEGLRVDIGEIT